MNRIVISTSGDGYFNLALDEYLLERHRRGLLDGVTLYFYVNSSAVIIGRNQNAWRECDTGSMESDGVQLVRRHTGGGAVFHDGGNLNFSFIADEREYDKERQNRTVVAALKALGITAEISGRNDITVDGKKISGCAYAISGTARGMHGTLLVSADLSRLSHYLRPSSLKLRAKGITSVRSRVGNLCEFAPVTVEAVRGAVCSAFIKEYGDCEKPVFAGVTADVVRLFEGQNGMPYGCTMEELYRKQSSWEWRMGASPVFGCSFEGRLELGEFQLLLNVKDGIVRSCEMFTDALDTSIPEEAERLLKGVRFERNALADALSKGTDQVKQLAAFIINGEEKGMLNEKQTGKLKALRLKLHSIAEPSGEEKETKAALIRFLRENTTLDIRDMGAWFYAVHSENAQETVAVRADFDAVATRCGAKHLCGHDGHSAALAGLGLILEGKTLGRNVILLFQHAEETGDGAKACLELFERERIDRIIGCHNIPGELPGTVLLKKGTFACASCGMEIEMRGAPTHAAYPENGIDPTEALARLALAIPKTAGETAEKNSCMTMSTNIGLISGSRSFGVAASDGSILVTLRSESTEALEELVERVRAESERLAELYCLGTETSLHDVFPATVNDDGLLDAITDKCRTEGVPFRFIGEPFRWSEDFGHYGQKAPAVFFGVGSGEKTAPLHTENYEYPDDLLSVTAETLYKLLK